MSGASAMTRVVVVGGGIGGVSVAAELVRRGCDVTVLENEKVLAYHTTGRSAAAFIETYGGPHIRALTRASRPLLEPDELSPRPYVVVANAGGAAKLAHELDEIPALRRLSVDELIALCPVLRPDWLTGGAIEASAQDLDVAAVFDRFRRTALAGGARIRVSAGLAGGHYDDGQWHLRAGDDELIADVVINAAGAWADAVAQTLGVKPIGLSPKRRTAAVASLRAPDPRARAWPLVCDVAEGFYFRPEGDGLLISLAEETPSDPCDAKPEFEDVALTLDRVNEATTLDLRHIRASWAGLRTFAPDRVPVAGPDPAAPGFYWLAGQGGYGMQTAAALAELVACAVVGSPLPERLQTEGVDEQALSPARFR
jgi:D-arginine dehydrogenase